DNKEAHAHELESELCSMDLGSMSISEYFKRIKVILDLLANINSPIEEKTFVMYVINGLDGKFEHVTSIIHHSTKRPTLLEARSMLLVKESRMNRKTKNSVTCENTSSPTVLMAGTSSNHGRSGPGGSNGRGSGELCKNFQKGRCTYGDHFCFVHTKVSKPSGTMNNGYGNLNNNMHGAGILGPTLQESNPAYGPFGPRPRSASGYWEYRPYVDQATTLLQAFNATTLRYADNNEDNGWYMDTGATSHLFADADNLTTVFNSSIIPSIIVGNRATIPVTNTGHSILPSLHRPLYLQNVLIIPNIIKNLISVRQFTRDNKCSIEFDEFGFFLKDYWTRQLLLRCNSSEDLYPFRSSNTTTPTALVSSTQSMWHRRLGHPGDEVLRFLGLNKFIVCNKTKSSTLCHACQLGKYTRHPFYAFTYVVENIFDIVLSDLWTSGTDI
ncbi:ribonuclease H-like domain-containing protein, partial [Tanacetum coccineum]